VPIRRSSAPDPRDFGRLSDGFATRSRPHLHADAVFRVTT